MNVQIIRVAMNDRDASMVTQSEFIENLHDVLMHLLVGKKVTLPLVPRPDEVHRTRTDADIPSAVGVNFQAGRRKRATVSDENRRRPRTTAGFRTPDDINTKVRAFFRLCIYAVKRLGDLLPRSAILDNSISDEVLDKAGSRAPFGRRRAKLTDHN